MQKVLDVKLGERYKSNSQKIRVMSEGWVGDNIFCPNCGSSIFGYENNKPVADFYCKKCLENFELKAKKGGVGRKIGAGAYAKMIERLVSETKPNLFLMAYKGKDYFINDFFVVPKYFFVPSIIEKRKALSKNAQRAGWIGANILFYKVPNSGKIYYIENGEEFSKKDILKKWQKTVFVKEIKKDELRGWILDIMNCIESLGKEEFELSDVYQFEDDLKILHPENKHIKDKIRQQLQFLRDKGYLKFLGKGKYKLT